MTTTLWGKKRRNWACALGRSTPMSSKSLNTSWGSFGHRDPAVRRKALEHMYECVDIMQQTGSTVLSLWFADGTNYPGQDDIIARKRRFEECLKETHAMPARRGADAH